MDAVLQETMMTLLQGAINDQSVSLNAPPDLSALTPEAARHGIENMLFFGARAAGMDKNDPTMRTLLHEVGRRIFITENQLAEAEAVCRLFDAAGIDHLPLKGMALRELYPFPDMRTMGDVDILIRPAQIPAIKQLLLANGFEFVLESAHEYVWQKKGVLYLELHKALFAEYETDFYKVFGDGWGLAVQNENSHRYHLSHEDHFLYVFVHFAKHYRGGGIGLRHLTDVAVYLRSGKLSDMNYIEKQLATLHMTAFYHNVSELIAAWLDDGEMTEKAAFISRQIWTSGMYGTPEAHRTADAERATTGTLRSSKRNRILKLLFPPKVDMQLQFPCLKNAPVLLPLFWVVRWVRLLIFKPKTALKRGMQLQSVSLSEIENKQQALRFVGLEPMADRARNK